MKKSLLVLSLFVSITFVAEAQKKKIDKKFDEIAAVADLTFLASDALKGRDPAAPEMAMAYNYIAMQLEDAGAKQVAGADGYFQNIPFRLSLPPSKGNLTIGDSTFSQGVNLLVLDGESLSGTYELVDVGFGTPEDFEGKDLTGKIAVSSVGAPDKMSPADLFSLGSEKTANAKKQGAIALIERFNIPSIPWQLIANYLNRSQMAIDKGESSKLPYIWVKDLSNTLAKEIAVGAAKSAALEIEGKTTSPIDGRNVIAWIEGTDKDLKNEYVMLSAHYDHVGIGRPDETGDSIYNGTRDNAIGTVAVMNAAKFFAKNPPKRSILLALWTAEEKGLLGSRYFAENPLIPLSQIIYNLNIDGAGYNDTSIITVIGLGRTSGDDLVIEAVEEFGLKALADPAPEQGLYDRSDNVNFAKVGIPAPTFSLGFTAFDDEINKYYHKAADEVDSVDLDYVTLFWKSYILAAQKIANAANQPIWIAGDKYEEAGKALYGDKE
ncbi:M28 family peptidase [Algoriphagus persicinus]|uniref:M28 family peptidase n=1 Tax=Algoriphagus persicinus TaxID=3108754 RepID=UPI002B3FA9ED|nr:M28 family peptidase [Algoriphagus sp. E1-3-M2]MEB2784014.1 M28 family peptidase [Algoriphagus sp. E1-3-M2]